MPINKVILGKTFLLAEAGVPNKEGIIYSLSDLVELCNRDSHLEMLDNQLRYREQAIPKVTSDKRYIQIVLPYDTYPTCTKCGEVHLFKKAIVKYLPEQDILQKTCVVCGHSWLETCHPINYRKGK